MRSDRRRRKNRRIAPRPVRQIDGSIPIIIQLHPLDIRQAQIRRRVIHYLIDYDITTEASNITSWRQRLRFRIRFYGCRTRFRLFGSWVWRRRLVSRCIRRTFGLLAVFYFEVSNERLAISIRFSKNYFDSSMRMARKIRRRNRQIRRLAYEVILVRNIAVDRKRETGIISIRVDNLAIDINRERIIRAENILGALAQDIFRAIRSSLDERDSLFISATQAYAKAVGHRAILVQISCEVERKVIVGGEGTHHRKMEMPVTHVRRVEVGSRQSCRRRAIISHEHNGRMVR